MSIMLNKRLLGTQGLEVTESGLGCMGMSHGYGPADDNESLKTLDRALELGVNFFDTAEFYGPYTNETLLGKWLSRIQTPREKVVVATKFGFDLSKTRPSGLDSRPEHIRQVVDASLKRLQTDYIDVLYQHRVDPDVPVEEVAGTVGQLIQAGKVRYFGLSEANPDTIRQAHREQPVSVLQSEYSLWERQLENSVIPVLRELGIGLVPFSPLGRGFLTGSAKPAEDYPPEDFRSWGDPRLQGENYQANMQMAQTVKEIAKIHAASPARVALAWLLHQGDYIVPIPGTKSSHHLEDNIGAGQVSLTDSDLARLNQLKVTGERYTQEFDRFVDKSTYE
jgi:aryl-alcohol dehydrogenase-like predicted oxidoreductase